MSKAKTVESRPIRIGTEDHPKVHEFVVRAFEIAADIDVLMREAEELGHKFPDFTCEKATYWAMSIVSRDAGKLMKFLAAYREQHPNWPYFAL